MNKVVSSDSLNDVDLRCPECKGSDFVLEGFSQKQYERSAIMLIHGKINSSEANGPGKRAVLWFQGCNLACKGCWNPETHSFNEKNRTSIGDIQDWILSLKDIEGITFSGGEPMQQAPYLYTLVAFIREKRADLTIGMYTGYTEKELENGNFKWKSAFDADWVRGSKQLWAEIKKHLDFAVVGRYIQSMACHDEAMRGSKNQAVLYYSDKYTDKDLPAQIAEVNIGEDAIIQITGYPTIEFLDSVNKKPVLSMNRQPVPCIKDDEDGDLVGV